MSMDKLKTRARNLQRAMQEALKQPVKLSLAYELVAKEEGYPNWDTACAMLQPASPRKFDLPTSITLRKTWHDQAFSMDRVIEENPSLSSVLDAISARPVMLMVISGKSGSGKSSLAEAMLMTYGGRVGKIDTCDIASSQPGSRLSDRAHSVFRMAPDIIFISELRTPDHVKLAVEAVATGHTVLTTIWGSENQPFHEMLMQAVRGVEALPEFELLQNGGMNCLHMHLDTGTAPSKQQVSVPGMQAGPVLARTCPQKTHRHTIHSADREALLYKLSSLKAAGYALERYLHLPQDQFTEERFDDLLAELDDADRSTRRLANSLRDDLSIAGARKIARHIKISEADILWFEREAARNRAKGNHFDADNYQRSVLLIRERLSEKLIPMQQSLIRSTDN